MTSKELRDCTPAVIVALRNAAPVLLDLWDAVQAWRTAECISHHAPAEIWHIGLYARCFGANHIESCPVEIARQDVIACSNKELP